MEFSWAYAGSLCGTAYRMAANSIACVLFVPPTPSCYHGVLTSSRARTIVQAAAWRGGRMGCGKRDKNTAHGVL